MAACQHRAHCSATSYVLLQATTSARGDQRRVDTIAWSHEASCGSVLPSPFSPQMCERGDGRATAAQNLASALDARKGQRS